MCQINIKLVLLVASCIQFCYSTEAQQKKDYHQLLGDKLLQIEPPFDLSPIKGISEECRTHSKYFIESLKNLDLWALNLHDATAKIPTGILNGNVNQFGNYDQCLKVLAPDQQFQGKYCLSYLQIKSVGNDEHLKHIRKLMSSYDMYRSEFEDPAHVVPRFSSIHWALCVPSSCSSEDVEVGLKEYVRNFTENFDFKIRIKVEDEMCHVKDYNWTSRIDKSTIAAVGFFVVLILICIASTMYDMSVKCGQKNEWCTAFSLKKNIISIFTLKRDPGDIKAANGIRVLNFMILLIAHKAMCIAYIPMLNRNQMAEIMAEFYAVMSRSAVVYTDTYLMLSGMLTAYSLFGRFNRGQKIKLFQEYMGRYIRIMPPIVALIIFSVYILPFLGEGPQWNTVVKPIETLCRHNWWRTLLLIQNYWGFENICITHTHYVAVDTQLFLVTPFLAYVMWKYPKKGCLFVGGLIGLTVAGRFYVTYSYNLCDYISFGTSITQLFNTANYMYILPFFRFISYGIGIFLGYVLRNYKNTKLSQVQITFGWVVGLALFLASFLYPISMGYLDYKFNPVQSAIYSAFSPIGWSLFLAWIIFVSENGYKSIFIDLLSWKGFMIVARFSYGLYLMQYTVFNYNIGTARGTQHFKVIASMGNFGEHFWIVVSALVLTIFVELPFGNIKKLVFNNKKVAAPVAVPITITEPVVSKPLLDANMNDVSQDTKVLNGAANGNGISNGNGFANGNGIHTNGSAKKID